MKIQSAINKTEKYLGVKVNRGEWRCTFQYGDRIGSFRMNNDDTVSNFHTRRHNDHTNAQVDYFAGYYLDNLTQLLHTMKPPPRKFANGDLIRGKDNKRAQTYRISGRTGLIVEARDDGYDILWNDNSQITQYCNDRDLEMIK